MAKKKQPKKLVPTSKKPEAQTSNQEDDVMLKYP